MLDKTKQSAAGSLHFVGQHVFRGFADRVIGRDLDHDAVEVLDDIFNLLCEDVSV